MANTFSQVLVQFVFAVKHRQNLIDEEHRQEIEKYICGIANGKKCKPLAIYCNPDHCHLLIGLNSDVTLGGLVREIKSNSSKWINSQKWSGGNFAWQAGYGVFSYSRNDLNRVVQYIRNQPEHHRRISFHEEYVDFLNEYKIEYDERYLFRIPM